LKIHIPLLIAGCLKALVLLVELFPAVNFSPKNKADSKNNTKEKPAKKVRKLSNLIFRLQSVAF